MSLRERIGLGLYRRILGRLSLAGRVRELEADVARLAGAGREGHVAYEAASARAAKAEAERDQAQQTSAARWAHILDIYAACGWTFGSVLIADVPAKLRARAAAEAELDEARAIIERNGKAEDEALRIPDELTLAEKIRSLYGRLAGVEAERDDAINERNAVRLCDSKVEAERDQALRDAEDLRKCHHEAEAELEALRVQVRERDECKAEALKVREEELAAALGLPQRRSWPDLLAAARRLQKAEENAAAAEQRAHELANRAAVAEGRVLKLMSRATCLKLEQTARWWCGESGTRSPLWMMLRDGLRAAIGQPPALSPAADPDPRQGTPGGADLLDHAGPGFPPVVAVHAHEQRCADGRGYWEGYNGRTKTYHRGVFAVEGGKVREFWCDDDCTRVPEDCAPAWTFKPIQEPAAVPPPPPAAPPVDRVPDMRPRDDGGGRG